MICHCNKRTMLRLLFHLAVLTLAVYGHSEWNNLLQCQCWTYEPPARTYEPPVKTLSPTPRPRFPWEPFIRARHTPPPSNG